MIKKWTCTVVAFLSSLLLAGCGEVPDSKADKEFKNEQASHSPGLAILHQKRLTYAVMMVRANVGNIKDSGGYQYWTPSKMVDALIRLSQTSGTHVPGEPRVKKQSPEITYVKGKVTKPWQIVLIPDDKAKKIIVKAYGNQIKKPAVQREIPVSSY